MTGINSNWRMLALQTLQQSLSTRSVTNSDTHCSQPRLHNYNAPALQSIQHLPFNDFSCSNRVRWASSCLCICIVNLSLLQTSLSAKHWWCYPQCVRSEEGSKTEEAHSPRAALQILSPPQPPHPQPHLTSLDHLNLNLSPFAITITFWSQWNMRYNEILFAVFWQVGNKGPTFKRPQGLI